MGLKSKPSDDQERQGVHIVGRLVGTLGHIFREQTSNDVGIDAHVELVDEKSRDATGQLVALQIKGGPSYFEETTKDGIVFRGDLAHLDYWLNHSLPVFLVLVDTGSQKAYWQEISPFIVERLDRGWKVVVPFTNELTPSFITAARVRVGLDATAFSYTTLALQDTSHPLAKRYSAKLLIHPPLSRLRAEAVVRRATADFREYRYNLEGFKRHFGDRDADVIWLYVAGELHDVEIANWYCRTMWVSNDLPAEVRPQRIGGIDLGDGLEVIWKSDYEKSSQFYRGMLVNKQEFLEQVRAFVSCTDALVGDAFGYGAKIVCHPDLLKSNAKRMEDIFSKSGDVGLPPYECKDVADRFGDVMSIADNAFIYAVSTLTEPANNGWPFLLETTLRDYRKNIERLQYELEKIR